MALQANPQLSLDGNQDAFQAYFHSLPKKSETTIRIFDRNDYFTVHGSDAKFTANEVFKTTSVIKTFRSGSSQLDYVTLRQNNFESFVRDLLLVRHYRVEVYRNLGNAKNENWKLSFNASPGNLTQFENILFGNNEMVSNSAYVMAVKLGTSGNQRIVGVAYAEATLQELGVCEFPDSDQFSNLEALIVQLGPKECLLSSGDQSGDYGKLKTIVERSGILITERKKSEFNSKDIVQDLTRLLVGLKDDESVNVSTMAEMEKTHAMTALSALIKFLELLNDDRNFNQFNMKTFDLKQYMRLDAAAVRALTLNPSHQDGNQMGSLLGLLNKCKTAQGQRLMAQWIKQPLMDKAKIEERLDMVQAFTEDVELRQTLFQEQLKRLPDFQRLAKKLTRKKATLQDCYRLYQAIEFLPSIEQTLDNHQGQFRPLLIELFSNPIKEIIENFKNFMGLIVETLDFSLVDRNEFLIKPDIDENLQDLRKQMDKIESKIQGTVQGVADDLGLDPHKTLKLESNSQLGYYFRVTLKDEKSLRNQNNYVVIDTNKSGIRFNNSRLRDLNENYLVKRDLYEDHQKTVVENVLGIAASFIEPMQYLNDVTAQLDVLLSFAHVTSNATKAFTRPRIHESGAGKLRLVQARHPCVEAQLKAPFIPNDISFEKGKEMFHIITGPNMGGKSTFIRQVGVIVLLAQMGCYVPCSEAEVSIVDCIMARVGASDSQLKGVSTFMAEMLETASILRSATENSLIIIDELGRGTSTYDGFGLAWAISEYIATEIKAFCMFATHFHELTSLADKVQSVNNLHVTALTTESGLTFLYQVQQGVCDQSFGIHVAEMVQFPAHVIDYAKSKAAELEDSQCRSLSASGGFDEPSAKKRRLEKQEADIIIKNFLDKIKQIPIDEMNEEEVRTKIESYRMEIKGHQNPFIQEFII